jgi:hypothetical protein
MQLPAERIGFLVPRRTSFDGLRIDRGGAGGCSFDMEMSGMLSIDGPEDSSSAADVATDSRGSPVEAPAPGVCRCVLL